VPFDVCVADLFAFLGDAEGGAACDCEVDVGLSLDFRFLGLVEARPVEEWSCCDLFQVG
jgi:hypothetical protein